MQWLTINPCIALFAIFLVSMDLTVLAQLETGGRNITIPTTTSSAPPSSATANNSTASANNNSTASNRTATPTNNTSTQNSSSTTTTKLTPIPDATGTPGNVPFPAATGGKPNSRFGPDDQYIAGFPKLMIPLSSSLIIIMSTVAVLSY